MTSKFSQPTLLHRIWLAAARNPEKCIVLDAAKAWTWRELLWRAQAYASAMADMSVSTSDMTIVPILVDRSGETVAAILGALIAGRGFAPLSPQQPSTRLNQCLRALNAKAVIVQKGAIHADSISAELPRRLILDIATEVPLGLPPQPPGVEPDQILYVLFTSGSTGEPKGVMADHRNIDNTMLWSMDMIEWRPDDVIGCCTNFYFDISMFDVFTMFYFDIPLAIYANPSDVEQVVSETSRFKITSVFGVPTFFSQILRCGMSDDPRLSSLRRIIAGGDFFPPAHVLGWRNVRPDVELFNVWGPTETSIVNTMHRITDDDSPLLRRGRPAPVGKSHSRMPFCLIDESGRLVNTPNQRGEICMLGACVTRGYLGDSAKTAQVYKDIAAERAFCTQDIGYVDERGNLFIVGRKGSTVKVAGYRVDLGEVESAAALIADIHLACAFVVEAELESDNRELWLALEPTQYEAELDIYSVKKFLRKTLPSYMVPKRVVVLQALPRNANGKIDRAAVARAAHGAKL